MNLNRAVIIGRVTQDPQLRTTPSGHPVCTFSIATNRIWNDSETQQRQEKTEFHNIVTWRRLAEIANQYLRRGSLVMIEGRIETRSWDDQQSGTKKYRTEIIAENMQLGPRSSSQSQGGSGPSQEMPPLENNRPGQSPAPRGQQPAQSTEIPTVESDLPIITADSNITAMPKEDKQDENEGEINVKNIPF